MPSITLTLASRSCQSEEVIVVAQSIHGDNQTRVLAKYAPYLLVNRGPSLSQTSFQPTGRLLSPPQPPHLDRQLFSSRDGRLPGERVSMILTSGPRETFRSARQSRRRRDDLVRRAPAKAQVDP